MKSAAIKITYSLAQAFLGSLRARSDVFVAEQAM